MSVSSDIIQDMIARLCALQPDFPLDKAARLEQELRRDWAGTEPYIAATTAEDRAARLAAALQAVQQGKPASAACKQHGVPRASLYRALEARAKRR